MKPTILAGIACAALLSQGAFAEQAPPPFAEFTFKKVAPPKDKGSRRITIQIEPQPDPPPPTESTRVDLPADLPDDGLGGFWAAVSPDLAKASPARLEAALKALDAVDSISGPRLDDMRKITDRYGSDILRHTVGTRVSPALVAAIISVEFAGRVDAVSSAGAQGVMQLMPATAARFGVTDWQVAEQNIKGGVAYLDWLTGEFDYDPVMILAGYNAGEGAVRNHGGVPPYSETRAYVPKVLAAWKVASGLCLTPPMLISDGCVFIGGS